MAPGDLDGITVDHAGYASEHVLGEHILGWPAVGDAIARRKQQDGDESENADQRGRH